MADTFELEIATPERLMVRETATEAQIPAKDGYIGVLPGHAPLLSELGMGKLTYTAASRQYSLAVFGGFVEVLPNLVRVLATGAEKIGEIDVKRAQESLRRAQERLTAPPTAGVDVARAINAMRRAQARLAASDASK